MLEQSDQGLHCLPFKLHLLDAVLRCDTKLFRFMGRSGGSVVANNTLDYQSRDCEIDPPLLKSLG